MSAELFVSGPRAARRDQVESQRTMQGDDLVHPAHVERDAAVRLRPASGRQPCAQVLRARDEAEAGRTELKWPSSEVPPENGVIGMRYRFAIWTTFWTSPVLCERKEGGWGEQVSRLRLARAARELGRPTDLSAQTTTVGFCSGW